MTSNEIFGILALLGIVMAAVLAHLTIKKGWKVPDFF
jgi:hypothetical protein